MSWSEVEPAFRILRPRMQEEWAPGRVSLNPTSTSTIEDPEDTGATTLRMYNVEGGDLAEAVTALPSGQAVYVTTMPSRTCPFDRSLNVTDGKIGYWDSRQVDGEEAFLLRPGHSPLHSTCVPRFRYIEDYTYIRLDYSGAYRYSATGNTGFHYNGVSVTQLPDDRWLMVMHRARILVGEPTGALVTSRYSLYQSDPRTFLGDRTTPSDCVTDIVGYIADDATFTRGLSGPFWLVDSKDALPSTELPRITGSFAYVAARLWLGVPSAVVVDNDLYIYYVFEKSEFFYDPPSLLGDNGGDRDESDYTGDLADFQGGAIAVKRIPLFNLIEVERRLGGNTSASRRYREEYWELSQSLGFDPVVPGDLLGRVQVYANDDAGAAHLFEDLWLVPDLVAYGVTSFGMIDPAAYTCGDGTISLVFVSDMRGQTPPVDARVARLTNAGQMWDGLGVWRARTLSTGEFGRDFEITLTWQRDLSDSVNVVAGSDDWVIRTEATVEVPLDEQVEDDEPAYGQGPYQNPNVTLLADGRLRVQCSGSIDATPTNALVLGSADSACPDEVAARPIDPHRRALRPGERPVPWVVLPERGIRTWIGR